MMSENDYTQKTDVSGGGLCATLLQVRDDLSCRYDEVPDTFGSKSLSSTEQWYSNMGREALRILHGLEEFHHYCFVCEVHVITDHNPLVAILGKDVAMLSQWLQCIILYIHKYRLCIPHPKLFITDWPTWLNHEENIYKKIWGLSINVNATETALDLPVCTSICDIQEAPAKNVCLQVLKVYIIRGWQKKNMVKNIQRYWLIRTELVMIDSVVVKGKWVIIPSQLQMHILKQLYSNHMGIEKTRFLVCESVYWVNMNADIGNVIKQCATC